MGAASYWCRIRCLHTLAGATSGLWLTQPPAISCFIEAQEQDHSNMSLASALASHLAPSLAPNLASGYLPGVILWPHPLTFHMSHMCLNNALLLGQGAFSGCTGVARPCQVVPYRRASVWYEGIHRTRLSTAAKSGRDAFSGPVCGQAGTRCSLHHQCALPSSPCLYLLSSDTVEHCCHETHSMKSPGWRTQSF